MRTDLGDKKPSEELLVMWIGAYGMSAYMARAEDLLDEMHTLEIKPTLAIYELRSF